VVLEGLLRKQGSEGIKRRKKRSGTEGEEGAGERRRM
jgi:hypothetical protein